VYRILLSIHIAAGLTALSSAAVVFLTALPMTLMKPNLFLLLIAVFSFYLASSGWLRARNRSGIPTAAEWIAAVAMVLAALAMGGRGVAMHAMGNSLGNVLLVFGGIGGLLAARDLTSLRAHRYRGTVRIAAHVGRMLGGTIAAVTAFAVVNVRIEPMFVVWLAPTVVLTPVIVYWNRRVRRPESKTARR
jgi:hypothetical protein